MALGVSKVWGSVGMGAWQVWGSGGLVERKCEEKGRTKSTKGSKRKEKDTKKEAIEPKRRAQAPKERSGGSPRFPVRRKVPLFSGVGYLGGRQGEVDGKRLGEPSGVAMSGPKD